MSTIPKVSCLLCRSEMATNMLDRHYNTKQCQRGGKFAVSYSLTCKHCDQSFDGMSASERANHTRWCHQNPNRNAFKRSSESGKRSTSQLRTPESITKMATSIKMRHAEGRYKDSNKKALDTRKRNGNLQHSDETKEKLRQIALASPHQRVCKSTHDYTDKKGRTFRFDSTWEDALANRLDDLGIEWDRPEPIQYELDGKIKNYFADFYLPAYDLYLDPKNSYAEKTQRTKLDVVSKMIRLIILRSKQECLEFNLESAERIELP